MSRPKGFSREGVLEKAVQLFWRKGFADTSLQDLEKATGVNKSGLYSEFRDKDDLFSECVRHYSRHSGIEELLSREPLGWINIREGLYGMLTCKGQKGCFVANSLRESALLPVRARAHIGEHSKLVHSLLEKNIRAANPHLDAPSIAAVVGVFSSGIAVRLNAQEADILRPIIDDFLGVLQKLKG